MWLNKKTKKEKLLMPLSGLIQDIRYSADDVFSSQSLGEGFIVNATDGKLHAPFDGRVVTIFDTKHAIGLISKHKQEMLIHIGLDTVELAGFPFNVKVSEGDKIKAGQLLLEIDFEYIRRQNKKTESLFIFTNQNYQKLSFKKNEIVDAQLEIGEILL